MSKKSGYRFNKRDFYKLRDGQKFLCPVSGRQLTPENCSAVHIQPLKKGGLHRLENIYLVDDDVKKLKSYLTEAEVLSLAVSIVQTLGRTEYEVKRRPAGKRR